jgi:hypothetical protein
MIVPEYCYNHWYETDKDICLFDNSITLHNRSVDEKKSITPNRLAYRIQYDFDLLTGETYQPFYQQEFNDMRAQRIELLEKAMQGMEYK